MVMLESLIVKGERWMVRSYPWIKTCYLYSTPLREESEITSAFMFDTKRGEYNSLVDSSLPHSVDLDERIYSLLSIMSL
jgi:hypothetical protein